MAPGFGRSKGVRDADPRHWRWPLRELLPHRRRAYAALAIGLAVSYIPLASLTAMVLYAFGVREGFQSTDSFSLSEIPTVIAFLVIAALVARVRAFVGATVP
jgi:polyferredoxin